MRNNKGNNMENVGEKQAAEVEQDSVQKEEGKKYSKNKFQAEEIDMAYPINDQLSSTLYKSKEKKLHDDKGSKRLAYFPDQEAPAPARRSKKESTFDSSHHKTNKHVLAHFPPNPYMHSDVPLFEEHVREFEQGTLPGAERVRGIGWDGNADDDSNTQYQIDPNATTNEYLAEAHAVEDPVLVEAKPDTFFRRNQWWIVGGGLALLMMIITTIVLLLVDLSGPGTPTSSPTTVEDGIEAKIATLIVAKIPGSAASLSNETLPQNKALQWIANKVNSVGESWYSEERILRQYSLVTLFLSTSPGFVDKETTPSWYNNDNWMRIIDDCDWYGVKCDGNDNIVGLNLTGNNLVGSIPADIRLLSTLVSLDFTNNTLSGTLPADLLKIADLSTLELAQNSLTGGIPSSVGQMTGLTLLDLTENHLSSTIPIEIGKVTSLVTLKLSHNRMIGSIPSEIGDLKKLDELHLHHNSLSHKLPTEMGKLGTLTGLYLQNNDLLGPLPSEIGVMSSLRNWNMSNNHVFNKLPKALWQGKALQNLESLDLSHNLLSGESYDFEMFGSSWGKLTSLQLGHNYFRGSTDDHWSLPGAIFREFQSLKKLDISSNFFSGMVSEKLFKMTALKMLNIGKSGIEFDSSVSRKVIPHITSKLLSLEELDLSNCNIHGSLPTEIGLLNQLTSVIIDSNSLTGSIPTEIGLLNQINSIILDTNSLTSTIPSQIGFLTKLNSFVLDSNSLSETIPSEIANLVQLKKIMLHTNELKGAIPTEIGNLTNLEILNLGYNNGLTGTIPTEIGLLNKLESLSLHSNQLSGTIPSKVIALIQLENLNLGNNTLDGTIPTEIGLLHTLEYLSLDSNEFTGATPTEIGSLGQLKHLSLGKNQLYGTIPTEIGNLIGLEFLGLRYNQLTETIATEIGMLVQLKILELDNNQLTGTIPNEIGYLDQMEKLHLFTNQLTGVIPPEIRGLATNRLSDLWLEDNLLSGSIPFSFCEIELNSIKVDCEEVTCHCCEPICRQYAPPSTMPSLSPSVLPSVSKTPTESPSQSKIPSSSPAPSQANIIVTIQIKFGRFPSHTGWNITDGDNNIIQQISLGTFNTTQQFETVDYQVRLIFGSNYTLDLLDLYGDVQNVHILLYLGDIPDMNRVLAYFDTATSISNSTVYPIPFLTSEEGIIEYTFQPTPQVTRQPTLSPKLPPTRPPTLPPTLPPTPRPPYFYQLSH